VNEHIFQNSLKVGTFAELFVKKYYQQIFAEIIPSFSILQICDYDRKEDHLQRKGIDGFVEVKIPYEVKTRDFRYYKEQDILLEIMAENENNKLGWVYTTESKIVIYLWFNQERDFFIGGYLLLIENIRKWLLEKKKQYHVIKVKSRNEKNNSFWTTISIVVPISDFPKNCLERISKKIFTKKIPLMPQMADYSKIVKEMEV